MIELTICTFNRSLGFRLDALACFAMTRETSHVWKCALLECK